MDKVRRSLARIAITGVVAMAIAPRAFAQTGSATGAERTVAAATTTTPAPGEDEALYSCKKRTGQVAVTFKPETELKDLITWVMGFTCKNFILDPRIVSTGKKVSVIAPNKMSSTEAYRVFLVALSTMGLTIVPKGNVLRIVESATAKTETVPIYKRGVPANEDQIVRYVLRPTYTQVETLRASLDQIRSPAGSVQTAGTMLVLTDYASQIRDMLSLARSIDVPGGSDGIYTIPVRHADATQLAQKLNEILGITGGAGAGAGTAGGAGRRGAPQPVPQPGIPAPPAPAFASDDVSSAIPSKILVDDRSNTLIVVSSEAGYLRVKALVERLDIALDTESGSAIHVLPLENALAEELANTLNNAMGQATQRTGAGGRPGQPGQPGAVVPVPQPPQPIAGLGNLDNLGASIEGQVRVIGDKPTNSLIVMSTGRDYIAIKDVVRRLDQPRRQVFIEALILEVQLAKELDLGTSSHGGLPVADSNALVLGGVQTPNLRSISAAASLASATGLIGGLLGKQLENSQSFLGTSIPSFGILFQALATQDNTDILSAPHIHALDNEKAEFSVGNNIPYKAGLSFGGFGIPGAPGAGAGGIPTGAIGQNIQREKLNLTLNITPHISSNDVVRLEVEQETKDIGGKDAELGPTWTERKLKTQVIVHDQQSVVIGGLIQERDIYNVTKVPLLGDIPILGYLFKYSTKAKKKTNLLILLTPYIVKDQLDLQAIRERKVRERQEFVESFSSLNEMKYQPKVDYRRKRGVIEEINRSIQAVDDDIAAQNALGRRRWVDPGPIEYGPSKIEAPEDSDSNTLPAAPPKVEPRKPDVKPGSRTDAKEPQKANEKTGAKTGAKTSASDAKLDAKIDAAGDAIEITDAKDAKSEKPVARKRRSTRKSAKAAKAAVTAPADAAPAATTPGTTPAATTPAATTPATTPAATAPAGAAADPAAPAPTASGKKARSRRGAR